ncbi:MAG: single-stranded-DNA-specific exonuclease RecJ [Deltaproteobacteria bacterium]|nr:single-stranded-DNA-specific exonuclease RecJ [Deltaproteobacteria bacterium]
MLVSRGFGDAAEARSFLNPSLASLPDPDGIPGMAAAAERVARAAHAGETVWVYTDYDADGVTSAALLSEFLGRCRIPCRVRLPRRDREGYGLHPDALRDIAAEGGTLVVTADTGISSVAEAQLARELGIDLVVTDHHTPGPELPAAAAVVNPKLLGNTYPDAMIAGVGVAWNLAAAVRRRLRDAGWFGDAVEPDVRDLLDLVALGTVTDVAPLRGVNRALVAAGLRRLNEPGARVGVGALRAVSTVRGELRAGHIGFQLGPRLNAAGRMEGPQDALDLLLCADPGEAQRLAERLDALNRRRQGEERAIVGEASGRVRREGWIPERWSLVVEGEVWHEGVLGIVASRLADTFHRPAVVVSLAAGKGSARSIAGLHLVETLADCASHLERFGGHAAAAGLRVAEGELPAFRAAFEEAVHARLTEEQLTPVLWLDAEFSLRDLSVAAVGELPALEPFGAGNPTPVLLARRVGVLDVRPIGQEGIHLKFRLEQGGRRYDGLAWRKAEGLARVRPGQTVDLAYTPQVSEWNGALRVQVVVEGMRPAQA